MIKFLFILALLLAPTPAFARDAADDLAESVLRMMGIDRARLAEKGRRMTALGPWVGAVGNLNTTSGGLGAQAQFGVSLHIFHDPLLNVTHLRDRILGVVVNKLATEARDGGFHRPESVNRKKLIDELGNDIKGELKSYGDVPTTNWPRSLFFANAEFDLSTGAGQGHQIRLGAGTGFWKLNVGGNVGVEFGTRPVLLLGPELSIVHLLGEGPTPLVLTVFTRYDFGVSSPNAGNTFSIGARLALDLI